MNPKSGPSTIIILTIALLTTMSVWAATNGNSIKRGDSNYSDHSEKIAMAYVIGNEPDLPDAEMFSHLIYSFAIFNDSLDGAVIKYPEKLKAMSDLKKQNPKLKVILGINDYRRPGFCEMTGDRKKRKAFVKSVKKIIKDFNLDGVDLDWEFPTIEGGGHNFTPEDDRNYVLLAKDLRKALGKDAWISYYSNFSGKWIDHKGMLPYVSYVNVSGYNMATPREGKPMLHHSALYSSDKIGKQCVLKAVEDHIKLGIPKEKILIGIPFYGKCEPPLPSEVNWGDFSKYISGLSMNWDDEAKAPYLSDNQGNLVMGFDDERSIAAKFDFIRTNELPGIFVWCYKSNHNVNRLGKVIEKLRKDKLTDANNQKTASD